MGRRRRPASLLHLQWGSKRHGGGTSSLRAPVPQALHRAAGAEPAAAIQGRGELYAHPLPSL
eukprot:7983868-Pyramimonas_sp.AAC.1